MLPGPVSTALLTSRSTPPHSATRVHRAEQCGPVVEVGHQWEGAPAGPPHQIGRRLEAAGQHPAPAGVGVVPPLALPQGATGDGHVPSAIRPGPRRWPCRCRGWRR